MQYKYHDFYSNFEGGVDSGDVEFTLDLWVNELSDIIVNSPQKIIDLLNKTNIPTKPTDSDEEIVDSIVSNLGTNTQLNRGISFLIAEQNSMVNDPENEDWKSNVDSVTEAYQSLFTNIQSTPTMKASVKTDLMQQIKAKVDASGQKNRVIYKAETLVSTTKKNTKKFWYIAGGVLAFGVLITVGVYYHRKNKLKKMACGGNMNLGGGATPTPVPTPQFTNGGTTAPAATATPTPTPIPTPTPAATVTVPVAQAAAVPTPVNIVVK